MEISNSKKDVEVLSLEEPFLEHSDYGQFWKWKERNKVNRINLYHRVVHVIAFLILIPYIVLIAFNISIPDSYSTLVSVVIGFYFAKSIIDKE